MLGKKQQPSKPEPPTAAEFTIDTDPNVNYRIKEPWTALALDNLRGFSVQLACAGGSGAIAKTAVAPLERAKVRGARQHQGGSGADQTSCSSLTTCSSIPLAGVFATGVAPLCMDLEMHWVLNIEAGPLDIHRCACAAAAAIPADPAAGAADELLAAV
jgi:hypothetical protein